MTDERQLSVAELMQRLGGDTESPRRRRRRAEEGGISVAELTGEQPVVADGPAHGASSPVDPVRDRPDTSTSAYPTSTRDESGYEPEPTWNPAAWATQAPEHVTAPLLLPPGRFVESRDPAGDGGGGHTHGHDSPVRAGYPTEVYPVAGVDGEDEAGRGVRESSIRDEHSVASMVMRQVARAQGVPAPEAPVLGGAEALGTGAYEETTVLPAVSESAFDAGDAGERGHGYGDETVGPEPDGDDDEAWVVFAEEAEDDPDTQVVGETDDAEYEEAEYDDAEYEEAEYDDAEADDAEADDVDFEDAEGERSGRSGALREWLLLIGQAVLGLAVGAGLFLGFQMLWSYLPWLALALAILTVMLLVGLVRVLRRDDDVVSIALAVLVGLAVTVGPYLLTR